MILICLYVFKLCVYLFIFNTKLQYFNNIHFYKQKNHIFNINLSFKKCSPLNFNPFFLNHITDECLYNLTFSTLPILFGLTFFLQSFVPYLHIRNTYSGIFSYVFPPYHLISLGVLFLFIFYISRHFKYIY